MSTAVPEPTARRGLASTALAMLLLVGLTRPSARRRPTSGSTRPPTSLHDAVLSDLDTADEAARRLVAALWQRAPGPLGDLDIVHARAPRLLEETDRETCRQMAQSAVRDAMRLEADFAGRTTPDPVVELLRRRAETRPSS